MSREIFEEIKKAQNPADLHERLSDYLNLETIKNDLEAIPNDLQKKEREVRDRKYDVTKFDEEIKAIEVDIGFQVNMEKEGNNKAKFSNDALRKAETARRLQSDKHYQELKELRAGVEGEVITAEIAVETLRNSFRAVMALKDLAVAELRLYSK